MNKTIMFLVGLLGAIFTSASFADQVNGYYKKDGTYVAPHYRSNANSYRFDNYSSQGNSNPYTGSTGYKPNEYSTPPAYNKSYGGGLGSGYFNPYGLGE